MSARAVSSATIAFGLVSIPIKLYAATQSKAVRFHLLHAADRSRLQQHSLDLPTNAFFERPRGGRAG